MSDNLNAVNLVGRVGANPDVKYFESGAVLTKLSLAVDRPTSRSDEPDWFALEIWGKTAEVAANYTVKGSLIGIQGSLKLDEWLDRNSGATRSKPVVKVDRLQLLSSKKSADSPTDATPQAPTNPTNPMDSNTPFGGVGF